MKPFNLYYHVTMEGKYVDIADLIHKEINATINRCKQEYEHNNKAKMIRSRFQVGKHVQLSSAGVSLAPQRAKWIGIVRGFMADNSVQVDWHISEHSRVTRHEHPDNITEYA